MLKRLFTLAVLASLAGCSNLSGLSEGYNDMTTSRTVGHWKGTQRCIDETFGATQNVEMKLDKDVMPLMSNGLLYIERHIPGSPTVARSWSKVTGESALGGNAIITGKQVLRQEGPIHWVATAWPGKFIDDNTMSLTACGSELILKRQPPNTQSSKLMGY